jgi:hypothetical protein
MVAWAWPPCTSVAYCCFATAVSRSIAVVAGVGAAELACTAAAGGVVGVLRVVVVVIVIVGAAGVVGGRVAAVTAQPATDNTMSATTITRPVRADNPEKSTALGGDREVTLRP